MAQSFHKMFPSAIGPTTNPSREFHRRHRQRSEDPQAVALER